MTLHCAGRLGILSWIYEQRQVIAFELGLIDEKPIAECGSAYLDDGLVIIQQDDNSSARPSAFFSAKEINLFFDLEIVSIDRGFFIIEPQYSEVADLYTLPPQSGIFHPPSLA
ncbi:MAG: hypothetical protein WDO15_07910 [Bacteroidota bacterium]